MIIEGENDNLKIRFLDELSNESKKSLAAGCLYFFFCVDIVGIIIGIIL